MARKVRIMNRQGRESLSPNFAQKQTTFKVGAQSFQCDLHVQRGGVYVLLTPEAEKALRDYESRQPRWAIRELPQTEARP